MGPGFPWAPWDPHGNPRGPWESHGANKFPTFWGVFLGNTLMGPAFPTWGSYLPPRKQNKERTTKEQIHNKQQRQPCLCVRNACMGSAQPHFTNKCIDCCIYVFSSWSKVCGRVGPTKEYMYPKRTPQVLPRDIRKVVKK
jgi:hypothetical protein